MPEAQQNYCARGIKTPNINECNLVVFMGPIGVGKTTLARALVLISQLKGISAKYSYIRLNHVFAYALTWIIARLLGKIRVEPLSAIHSRNPFVFKRLFKLWLYVAVFSLALKHIINISIASRLYKRIFIEDYLVVTMCDLAAILNAYEIPLSWATFMVKFLLKLLLRRKVCIVLLRVSTYDSLIYRWMLRRSINRDICYAINGYSYIKFHDKCAESLLRTLIQHFPKNFDFLVISDADKLKFSTIINIILMWLKTP